MRLTKLVQPITEANYIHSNGCLQVKESRLEISGAGECLGDLSQDARFAGARASGVYGPHLARQWGGLGLDWRGVAVVFEEAGTSLLGPLALNGAAPDEANMNMLEQIARPDQQERYLRRNSHVSVSSTSVKFGDHGLFPISTGVPM